MTDIEEKPQSLGSKAARGAAITVVGQLSRVVIQFGGLMVLARLLSPEDYGLVAMVLAIVGIADLIREFGLSSAAIQARTVTDAQRSNLWWINIGLGALLSCVAFGAGPLIAWLYGRPELTAITWGLAATFVLNGACTQHRADLYRRFRFKAVVVVDVGAQACAMAVGVLCALAGAGYWSLVWQNVAQAVAACVFVAIANPWVPGWFTRGVGTRAFLRFGWNLLATQAVGYASRNIDTIIVGARFSAADVGIYSRAFQLFMLPMNQLNSPATKVALPVLSRLQDDKDRFAAFILRGQTALMHVVVALFAIVFAVAPPLVDVLLGGGWDDVVPILRILIVGGLFQAAGYAVYWAFLSLGLTGANLRYTLVARTGMILCILAGSMFGMTGVATGYAIGLFLMWPFGLWWLSRVSEAPSLALLKNGLRIVLTYVPTSAAGFVTTAVLADVPVIVSLPAGLAACAVVCVLTFLVLPAAKRDLGELKNTAALVRRKKK